ESQCRGTKGSGLWCIRFRPGGTDRSCRRRRRRRRCRGIERLVLPQAIAKFLVLPFQSEISLLELLVHPAELIQMLEDLVLLREDFGWRRQENAGYEDRIAHSPHCRRTSDRQVPAPHTTLGPHGWEIATP